MHLVDRFLAPENPKSSSDGDDKVTMMMMMVLTKVKGTIMMMHTITEIVVPTNNAFMR